MAKCPKCSRRKAKRACPALGVEICESCCGSLRLKEIPCQFDCPFFSKSELARKHKQIERGQRLDSRGQPAEDFGARVERFQLELERMVCSRNRSFNDVTDHEIMQTAQDALAAVEADPDAEPPESHEPTLEELFCSALRQGPASLGDLTPHERRAAVEALVQAVKPYAAEGGGSRNYIAFLLQTVDVEFGAWRTSDETMHAIQLLRQSRPLAALDILQRESLSHPDDAALHDLLAVACGESGRHEEGFEAAQKAVGIYPENVGYLSTLIHAAANTGRVCAAWNVATKALALDPPPTAKTRLRQMERQLMEGIQKQLAQRPHFDMEKLAQFERTTHAGLGAIRQGDFDKAETFLTEAVQIDPNCADTQALLGQVYTQQQRWDDARKALGAALQIDPAHESAQRALEAVGQMEAEAGPKPPPSGGLIIQP